jgi:branched-subunit amino acid transport protein
VTWIVMLAVGAGSFVFRLAPLLVLERITLSDRGDRVIRHAGTAAITALIVVTTKHNATGGAVIPTVLAIAVAVVLAARGASMVRLLVFGGATYACAAIVMELLTR